jgi:hypothetical protein
VLAPPRVRHLAKLVDRMHNHCDGARHKQKHDLTWRGRRRHGGL